MTDEKKVDEAKEEPNAQEESTEMMEKTPYIKFLERWVEGACEHDHRGWCNPDRSCCGYLPAPKKVKERFLKAYLDGNFTELSAAFTAFNFVRATFGSIERLNNAN